MAAIDTIIVGAGSRGLAYGRFATAYPRELNVVGLAEPDPIRRERFLSEHDIAPHMVFKDWQSLLEGGRKLAATVINCTMDRMHFESTMRMLDLGYDVLLEKPMAPVLEENLRLVKKAEDTRAAAANMSCASVYALSGKRCARWRIRGRWAASSASRHRENLIYYHMAHSFVRGNWRQ